MQAIGKVLTFLMLMFVISMAVAIASRLDQLTVSLLSGVMVGMLMATPVTALVTYLTMRQRQSENTPAPYTQIRPAPVAPPVSQPPQIVMLPAPAHYQLPMQMMRQPQYQSQPVEPFSMPPQRRFYMIGVDGSASEIQPDAQS